MMNVCRLAAGETCLAEWARIGQSRHVTSCQAMALCVCCY